MIGSISHTPFKNELLHDPNIREYNFQINTLFRDSIFIKHDRINLRQMYHYFKKIFPNAI